MAFKDDFVVVIKVNGKVLRENYHFNQPYVTLPFMSEYTISMKNKSANKASVKPFVDGKPVLDTSIILDPGEEIDLEGFLNDGLVVKNKFRFIHKTKQIQEHRGDRLDDGIVTVEYQFEEPPMYPHRSEFEQLGDVYS